MTEFVFEGAMFSITMSLVEWRKQKPTIELPFDVKMGTRYVQVSKWFPTLPPRPSIIEEVELEDKYFLIHATLVKEAPKPLVIEEPLTHVDVRNLMRHQRLRFLFRLPFMEFLDFTMSGFQGWIEMQYLHANVRGELKDVKYKPKEIIGNDIVIEIDCDPRNLT